MPSREARRLPMTLALSGPAGGVLGEPVPRRGHRAARPHHHRHGRHQLRRLRSSATAPRRCTNTRTSWDMPVRHAGDRRHRRSAPAAAASAGSTRRRDPRRAAQRGCGARPGMLRPRRQGPTVTDANMVLGILEPDVASRRRARRSIRARSIARDRSRSPRTSVAARETAEGIYRIVNANMAAAIRHVTVEKGIDPRGFALVPFGGAGGQHAVALAMEIGIPEVVIPNLPSVFSAFGMVSANMRHSRSRTLMAELDDATLAAMPALFDELEQDAKKSLADESAVTSIVIERAADLRYVKQAHEIAIEIRPGDTVARPVRALRGAAQGALRHGTRPRGQRGDAAHDRRRRRPADHAPASCARAREAAAPGSKRHGISQRGAGSGFRPHHAGRRRRAADSLPRRGSRFDALHPAPAAAPGSTSGSTFRVTASSSNTDPFTQQIIRNYLVATAQEMVDTTVRTAYSPTFAEGHDFSCALFDNAGRMVIQSRGIGVHLGSLVGAMQAICRRYDTFAEGDIVMTNNPYLATHQPDCVVCRPMFYQDRADRLRGQHRPLDRHRRHGARRLRGHGDARGSRRPHHPDLQAVPGRPPQRGDPRLHPGKRAPAGRRLGRPAKPDRRHGRGRGAHAQR